MGEWRVPLLLNLSDLANADPGTDLATLSISHLFPYLDAKEQHKLATLLNIVIVKGKVVYLLDGLDEVDPRKRDAGGSLDRLFHTLVEQCKDGSGNRLVITCRVAGYEQQQLVGSEFDHYVILGMMVAEQRRFIERWFAARSGKRTLDEATQARVEGLLKELEQPKLARLAEVPLLLELLAELWHADDGKLPRTRAGIYRRAIDLLLHWRSGYHEDDNAFAELRQQVYATVPALAYSMFCSGERQLVSSRAAIKFVGKELWLQLRKDEGGLFVLRGQRSPEGDEDNPRAEKYRLYGLPHRTFLEYFAGCYLVCEPAAHISAILGEETITAAGELRPVKVAIAKLHPHLYDPHI